MLTDPTRLNWQDLSKLAANEHKLTILKSTESNRSERSHQGSCVCGWQEDASTLAELQRMYNRHRAKFKQTAATTPKQTYIIKALKTYGSLTRPGPHDSYFTPSGAYFSGLAKAMAVLVRSGVVHEETSLESRVYTLVDEDAL